MVKEEKFLKELKSHINNGKSINLIYSKLDKKIKYFMKIVCRNQNSAYICTCN